MNKILRSVNWNVQPHWQLMYKHMEQGSCAFFLGKKSNTKMGKFNILNDFSDSWSTVCGLQNEVILFTYLLSEKNSFVQLMYWLSCPEGLQTWPSSSVVTFLKGTCPSDLWFGLLDWIKQIKNTSKAWNPPIPRAFKKPWLNVNMTS